MFVLLPMCFFRSVFFHLTKGFFHLAKGFSLVGLLPTFVVVSGRRRLSPRDEFESQDVAGGHRVSGSSTGDAGGDIWGEVRRQQGLPW